MEQRALRFGGYAISAGRAARGGNGAFDVLCFDVYGEQFEKACIYPNAETDGITQQHFCTAKMRERALFIGTYVHIIT